MARILVINPNSSAAVTAAMDRALDPLRAPDGPEIVCVTNPGGPAGIESQADADLAAVQTAAMVAAASAGDDPA
ncbi:MAG: aspartate/glutamate racemase family protein, partial [Thalassobaculaceae bacterium]